MFEQFELRALERNPQIAFYFRYPLRHIDFRKPRGHLGGRMVAKPLYGQLTRQGRVGRSAGFDGRIAIIFIPVRACTPHSCELMFTWMSSEHTRLHDGRRNWPAIRATAE